MTARDEHRERRAGWRLTQIVVLAAFGLLAWSFTGADPGSGPEPGDGSAAQPTSATGHQETSDPDTPDGEDGPDDGSADRPRSFTLAVAGEVLVHEYVADAARAASGSRWDFGPMFAPVEPILAAADLALCHLETPLSADNSDLSYYPGFSVPHELSEGIAGAGFDGCSVASNHSLDAGVPGVSATLGHLADAGVAPAGMATEGGQAAAAIHEAGDTTVAHLSYTDLLNGAALPTDPPWLVAALDPVTVLADARAARNAGAEFVVVSAHWGGEYVTATTDRQAEITATLLASDDVDLVIGHGAHVVQPVTVIDGEYAVVGLGNFLSNQPGDERRRCNECPASTQDGMIAWFEFTEGEDGRFAATTAGYYPTWVDRSNYRIIPLGLDDPATVEPSVLAEAARRTAEVVEPALDRLDTLPQVASTGP